MALARLLKKPVLAFCWMLSVNFGVQTETIFSRKTRGSLTINGTPYRQHGEINYSLFEVNELGYRVEIDYQVTDELEATVFYYEGTYQSTSKNRQVSLGFKYNLAQYFQD